MTKQKQASQRAVFRRGNYLHKINMLLDAGVDGWVRDQLTHIMGSSRCNDGWLFTAEMDFIDAVSQELRLVLKRINN